MGLNNNQCLNCRLFTTSPTGYCDNCTRQGRGKQPIGAGPASDSVIMTRPVPTTEAPVPFGLKRLRTDAEIARNEHPEQRLQVGDAAIRYGGRDPDIFDRIHNLCKAMRIVADDLRNEVRSAFAAGPMGETTAIARPITNATPDAIDRRMSLVRLMGLIADDMKKFSQKDEETWQLIGKMRNLGDDLETYLDLGGEAREIVKGLRNLSGALETHVERRRGY